jgi:thiosulfate reductase cytochrome b subunit
MKRIFLHPFAVRLWHWVNALCFILLILTGIQIRYHVLGWMTFKTAVEWHNVIAFVLIGNLVFWAVYHLVSGKIRLYIPKFDKQLIYDGIRQARYYGYGMMKGEKNPHHMTAENKFNTLQKLTYAKVMLVLLPLQCISGVLLWDPQMFSSIIALLGGLKVIAIVHVVLFIFFTAFMFGHIYLATLGHTPMAHIKAMFTGYEDEHDEADPGHQEPAPAETSAQEPASHDGDGQLHLARAAASATAAQPLP